MANRSGAGADGAGNRGRDGTRRGRGGIDRCSGVPLRAAALWLGLVGALAYLPSAPRPGHEPPPGAERRVPMLQRPASDPEAEGREEREEGKSRGPQHPDGYMRYRYEMRNGEKVEIPMDALVRAKERIDRMREAGGTGEGGGGGEGGPRDGGLWSWQWLGPGNIGGRIRSILIHPTLPSRIFVGAVSGGIWRTDNGGSSWYPVDDFMGSLAVTSLIMDPTNSSVLYAGTGEGFYNFDGLPGAWIFKSTDGGVSWLQLSSTNNNSFRYVNRLVHHPTSANTLYAALRDAFAVVRSTDGGSNWTTILTTNSPPADVKLQASNPSRILVGCQTLNGGDGQVWLSTDGGSSWTEKTTGAAGSLPDSTGRCEGAFGSGNTFYVLMNRNEGEIWRTTNAGSTWTLRGSPPLGKQLWYNEVLWVDPTDGNFVIAGGLDLYRSVDGGATFTRISDWTRYIEGLSPHADQHAIAPHPGYNGTSNRSVYFANDGGIQLASNVATVTTTSGWTNLANGLGITQFYRGAAASDGSVIVGGTQDNDKLRYTGGDTESWYQAAAGDGADGAVDPTNPDVIYGCYPPLWVSKSTNGGDSYFGASAGLGDTTNALSVAPISMNMFSPSTLYAAGTRIWKTTNGGTSWFQRRAAIPSAEFCSALDVYDAEVWAGYKDGTVSYSTNGGTNWTDVDGNGLPDLPVTDVAISPHFIGEAIVTFGGYVDNNVWRTTNYGASWVQRTGSGQNALPAIQVNAVTYHPVDPDWIYVGTDLGLFASEDSGANWNVTPAWPGGHDAPSNVEIDDLFWHGEYLVVATHGRGMYRSRPLTIVYVDRNNAGFEDGSALHPYSTVSEGLGAAGNGTDLSIRTGSYDEGAKTFNKRGRVLATGGTVVVR